MTKTDDWQLVLGGWDEGGHEDELRALCRELGLSHEKRTPVDDGNDTPEPRPGSPASVTFLGPVYGEAKEALLRSAEAFILPSFSEGLPMTVLEAWA